MLEQLVENEIQEKMQNGESFTAHDITRAVRANLDHFVEIEHKDVRVIVHDFMDSRATEYSNCIDASLRGRPIRYSPIVRMTVTVGKMSRDQCLALGRPLGGKAVASKTPPDVCNVCGASFVGKTWHSYIGHLSAHARANKS